jgi:hypothetical protein
MNIEDLVFAPKKEKKEKTCGKKMEQFWFLLTTMTVTEKERKKEKSSLSKFTTWFMFADIYLIVIGQKQKKIKSLRKAKKRKVKKSKQR